MVKMTRRFAVFALVGVMLSACATVEIPSTTIYLMRHAEKEKGRDPALTTQGQARAELLATKLSGQNVTTIWSSNYNRTRQTVAPLASATGITTQIYNAGKSADFIKTLKSKRGVHVVAGHSNTVPAMVHALDPSQSAVNLSEMEYDRLYTVSFFDDGRVATSMERFGRASN